jgi:threonine aldolase
VTLKDISDQTDLFWIGGTKNGAFFGEAIIIKDKDLAKTFSYHVKQCGSLMAKGRVLNLQFAELFHANLFFDLATRANKMAENLSSNLKRLQYSYS